jgi:hypothetical protein
MTTGVTFDLTSAIASLCPTSQWSMIDEDYNKLTWLDSKVAKPTLAELQAERDRLQAESDSKEYQRLRQKEYPPVTDYLDAVVKGDQAQMQAYIDACLAVKDKYPKAGA